MLRLPRHDIRELVGAKPNGLEKVEIQPGGDGISFRSIDVNISVPGLLADLLGPLFARALGRRARGRSSEKKAKSSRVNGKKGGRPTKRAFLAVLWGAWRSSQQPIVRSYRGINSSNRR